MNINRRGLMEIIGVSLTGSVLGGCLSLANPNNSTGDITTSPQNRPNATNEQIAEYVKNNYSFGIELSDALVQESPESNIMFSPISISSNLAMAWAGARGETESQMRDALNFPLGQESLHQTVGAVQYDLHRQNTDQNSNEFEYNLVNSLWGQEEYPFRETYIDTIEENYGSGFQITDFKGAPDQSRTTINNWIANVTNNHIETLLPKGSIGQRSRLVITNAAYLLGEWKRPFDPEKTEEMPFTNLDGSTTQVPMMHQVSEFSHTVDRKLDCVVIELPYVGEQVSMVIILPEEKPIQSLNDKIDGKWLDSQFTALDEADLTEISFSLPRFEFETTSPLSTYLREIGMDNAFDSEKANFHGIAPPNEDQDPLYIDEIHHKTYAAVDEKGVEAAIASGTSFSTKSGMSMTVDRPFIFLMRDRTTGSILFYGRIVDARGIT